MSVHKIWKELAIGVGIVGVITVPMSLAREAQRQTVLLNLQRCVTANVPKNEVYDGFEVRPLRDDPSKFVVLHAWSNIHNVTNESLHQRASQERRCNKIAFGKAVEPN